MNALCMRAPCGAVAALTAELCLHGPWADGGDSDVCSHEIVAGPYGKGVQRVLGGAVHGAAAVSAHGKRDKK